MKFYIFLLTVFLLLGQCSGQYYDTKEEDDISQEINPDVFTDDDDHKPDIICAKGRMCKCLPGAEDSEDPNVVNCSHAKLKDYGPLETANLQIQLENYDNFKAQVVKLDNNNIQYLQKGLIMHGQESNILSLDFSFNKIATLEKTSFDIFPQLVKLKLTHNRLHDYEISDDWLTKTLGKSLHQLYLDYNYIENPDDGVFDNLVNLTKLVLDGNHGLKLTSKTFGIGLSKLRTLSLDNCDLNSLDDGVFKNLVSLSQLSLSGNKFTTIPKAISTIPKLSILAVSENPIVNLQSIAFHAKANKKLKTIFLRKMPVLQEVEACAFCELIVLGTVDLTGSKNLRKLDERAFGFGERKNMGANKVHTLLLGDCALTSVSKNLLLWGKDIMLALNRNPLHCDCENMQWLMINNDKIQFSKEKPTCAAPEKLKGMSLKEANKQGCGAITSSSNQKMTLIVVLVGLCASIFVVGFFYARSKGGVHNFQLVGRPASPKLGFSNLTARANPLYGNGMDDEERLEDDFNRPEFV